MPHNSLSADDLGKLIRANPRFAFCLLVAQRFDRVEPGGFDGRQHSAHQAHQGQNDGGNEDDLGIDNEPDIGRFGIHGNRAVEGEAAHANRNRIGDGDARNAAGKGDRQGFGQKLKEDVAPTATEGLFHADLSGALGDRYQHDIHQSDAADAQRQRADESQQYLQARGDDLELLQLPHHIEDEHGALVVVLEVVLLGENCAHLVLHQFVLIAFVVEPDAVQIVRVFEIAHGAEGDIDHLVDAVVTLLHMRREHAYDPVADTVDAHVLTQGIFAGEQLGLGLGADDRYPRARQFVVLVHQSALSQVQSLNLEHAGINAVDGKSVGANILLHNAVLPHHRGDAMHQWRSVHNAIYVVEGELDLSAGFLPTGLLRSAPGKDADNASAPIGEDDLDGAAEACSVGQQQNDRCNAPSHSQHGQRGAAPIVAHGAVGLCQQIFDHNYSCLRASTGCNIAALRAG